MHSNVSDNFARTSVRFHSNFSGISFIFSAIACELQWLFIEVNVSIKLWQLHRDLHPTFGELLLKFGLIE